MLSVRNRTKRGFADVRARCETEPELLRHGSGFVLYALMDTVVDRYFPVLDALETELENLEEQIFAGGLARRNIEALYALKQKLMVLRHAVRPARRRRGQALRRPRAAGVRTGRRSTSATSTTTSAGSTRRSTASATW